MNREILFRGKRLEDGAWVEGYYAKATDMLDDEEVHIIFNPDLELFPRSEFGTFDEIDPDTLGQYTGMHEFVNQDPSVCGKLFEGDIVEVWSRRRIPTESYWTAKSQYDGECLVRATIVFKWGKWRLDYDNEYNNKLAAARGGEEYDRVVNAAPSLCDFSTERFNDNGESFRRLNTNKKWYDIVRIGCIHDNPELLEV